MTATTRQFLVSIFVIVLFVLMAAVITSEARTLRPYPPIANDPADVLRN